MCSTPYEEVVLDLTIDCDSPLLSTASDDTIPMIVIDCDDKSSEREHEKGIENKMRVEFPSSGSTSSNNDPEVEIRVDDFSPPKFPLIKSSVTPFDKSPASIYESTSSSNENLDNNFNKSSLSARSAEQILVLSTVEKLKLQYSEKINSQKNLGKDTRALQMIALNKEENKFLKNILELAKNPDSGFGFVNGDQDGWGNCQSSQSPSQSSQDSCASSHRGIFPIYLLVLYSYKYPTNQSLYFFL